MDETIVYSQWEREGEDENFVDVQKLYIVHCTLYATGWVMSREEEAKQWKQ